MKPWEIWSYKPAGWPNAHPAVIVSSQSRVSNKPDLNVLMCTSQRATRAPAPVEVILDSADGLNWPSLCKCDLLHLVNAHDLTNRRGKVTEERRRQIIDTMIRANEWR